MVGLIYQVPDAFSSPASEIKFERLSHLERDLEPQEYDIRKAGRTAIVGSFGKFDDNLDLANGRRIADNLRIHGIIGDESVVGLQIVTLKNQSSPRLAKKVNRQLRASIHGLRVGIQELNQVADESEEPYKRTLLPPYFPDPIALNTSPEEPEEVKRFKMDFLLTKVFSDFDTYLRTRSKIEWPPKIPESEDDSPSTRASLIIVADKSLNGVLVNKDDKLRELAGELGKTSELERTSFEAATVAVPYRQENLPQGWVMYPTNILDYGMISSR